ncbi:MULTISPECIES: hypothetical protein [Enterobacteriaceae]|jgi:predicted DNA-binding protein (UPF0251 family)|uniref:hypothetical protein n=1 Tax=Enterobacteriaceae TaxID=543 RepID=UPI001898A870|nr:MULTISPECIES: hypothetical protein [Enterobacteriaceae]MBK4467489.1 hypothetical protein [Enterobacter asburiae]MBK4574945.1 hypothetical protein [Enterobacter asburiae]QXC66430.1 hypothetical protein KSL85_02910 [Klebsiella aerogenes]UKS47508.1 hypothetical protein L3249_03195 [Klebsiella michiganensis]
MATKKSTQNAISPELQSFIDEIAVRYQPDPEALHRRIENAEARYNRYQNFTDIPARLVDKLQSLILEGWRFHLAGPASVIANPSMISVTLQKPVSLIEQELEALRVKTSEAYHNELIDSMELAIDTLIAEAAEDARRQAEEQAIANQSAMRGQLRNLLKQGIV